MNVIGLICVLVFLGAGVVGLMSFFYVTLREAPRVKIRFPDSEERKSEYERIYQKRDAVFFLSWLVMALAFVFGAWLGGWSIN